MKHSRRPWPARDLALARVLIDFLALGFDHRNNLDSMFATTDDASQRFPCIEREHVFARFDLGFRIPFAANPWKIAGKLLNDWPETARFSDSSLAWDMLPWGWPVDTVALASIVIRLTLGVRLC
jgi:hypothetical protein